jgi:hypothetical protein
MNVSLLASFSFYSLIKLAVLDNGTFRDSVWYNLLGEEFINLAVSVPP